MQTTQIRVTSRQISEAAFQMGQRGAPQVAKKYGALAVKVATEQKGFCHIDLNDFLANVIKTL